MKNGTKLLKIFNINKLNYKIMKKVFIIVAFDKKSHKYAFTCMRVFASKKIAKKYRDKLNSNSMYNMMIIKVDLIKDISYL